MSSLSLAVLQNLATDGSSPAIDLTGLTQEGGPIAHIIISDTASVAIQCAVDKLNWVDVGFVTVTDLYVLDPRGMYYRFTVSVNTGTVDVIVSPGAMEDGRLAAVRFAGNN